MKLSEITTIEHQTAPMELDVSIEQQRTWLSKAIRTDLVTAAPGAVPISIFKLELDTTNHVFIFTSRVDQSEPVGYCILSKSQQWWKILSIWLKPSLRGRGYVTNIYRALTAGGYNLISGDVVSKDAERVWLSLGRAGIAKVLDLQTKEVRPFDESPIGDGNLQQNKKPRYYWVTEGQDICLVFDRGNFKPSANNLREFIEGIEKGSTIGSLGIGCLIIDAEV